MVAKEETATAMSQSALFPCEMKDGCWGIEYVADVNRS